MSSSSTVCVDANLVVRLVTDPNDEPVWRHWGQWDAAGTQVVAPSLLRYEVTNALYRLHRAGDEVAEAARLALRTALDLPIRLHDDTQLHTRAFDLADRFRLPAAYDAQYLALAQQLGVPFWTADRRLARAVSPALPWVHLIAMP